MQLRSEGVQFGGVQMKTVLSGFSAAAALAMCVAGCCKEPVTGPAVPKTDPSSLWTDVAPNSGSAARRQLDPVVQRYGACRSYRDRGTLVGRVISGDAAKRPVEVSRFDTLFVRDVGLRFRFHDEQGRLQVAIWRRGDETVTWQLGTATKAPSIEDALTVTRGVTGLTSEVIPRLLMRIPAFSGDRAVLSGEPGLAGTAPTSCGKCWLLAFGSRTAPPQFLLTVDENARSIRRFQAAMVVRQGADGQAASFGSETLINYEPEFDLADEATLARELAVQPW
jgi:hypothetical protein